MSYKIVEKKSSQKNNGVLRYDLYIRHNNKPYRKRVKATRSTISVVYKSWLDKVFSGNYEKKRPKLFNALEEYLQWSEIHKKKKQVAKEILYIGRMKEYFKRNQYLDEINHFQAKEFIFWFQRNSVSGKLLMPETVNRAIGIWHYFYGWCKEREYFSGNNPFSKIRLKNPNKNKMFLLETEQIADVLKVCEHQFERNFIILGLTTGMRPGEIRNLKWEDISFERNEISVMASKTEKRRVIPMIEFLSKYLNKIKRECVYVVSYFGREIGNQRMYEFFKKIKQKLTWDASDFTPNQLRHNCATFLKVAGVPMYLIQSILGHSSVSMTEKYSMIDNQTVRNEMMKMNAQLEKVYNICTTG